MVFKHTIVLFGYLFCVNGHGFLLDPPQRSSLWRIYPGHFPPNYNDNALNCGGRLVGTWFLSVPFFFLIVLIFKFTHRKCISS